MATKSNLTDNGSEGGLTLRSVWEQLIHLDKLHRSPATIKDYESRAKRLFLPTLGDKLIRDVTQADVEKVVRAANGPRSQEYILSLLKKLFNFATKRSECLPSSHRNPCNGIRLNHDRRQIARSLTLEEIRKFGATLSEMELTNEVSPRLANLFRLSLICGLRPMEVRTLTWSRVNLNANFLTVPTRNGFREIHLTDAALQILKAVPRVEGCEYVFAGRKHGRPIVGIYKQLTAIQARAGIERFRPYDLHHSATTGSRGAGTDDSIVQALMGHKDTGAATPTVYAEQGGRLSAGSLG